MPVVPISSGASTQQRATLPPLDPTFALIAAAQMHSEGRLVQSAGEPDEAGLAEAQGNKDYLQRKFDMGMALFNHDDQQGGPNDKNYKAVESAMEEAIPGISKMPAKVRAQLLIAPSYEEGKKIPGMNTPNEDESAETGPRLGKGQTFDELWTKLQKFKSSAKFKSLMNQGDPA